LHCSALPVRINDIGLEKLGLKLFLVKPTFEIDDEKEHRILGLSPLR